MCQLRLVIGYVLNVGKMILHMKKKKLLKKQEKIINSNFKQKSQQPTRCWLFLLVVEKYSNSSYIYLLPDLSPTGNIRVQEGIKDEFYYDRKNMNLKCECLWRIWNISFGETKQKIGRLYTSR